MTARKHLQPEQFDKEQLTLFNDEGDHASATMRKNDVMAWMNDKEKGFGKSKWYPGWASDNGYEV